MTNITHNLKEARNQGKLTGWRVATAKVVDGKPVSLYSVYSKDTMPFRKILADHQGFHVGTTEQFCRDYYTGMSDPAPGVQEVLMRLEFRVSDLVEPGMAERWTWPTGTEAIVRRATVVDYEVLPWDV